MWQYQNTDELYHYGILGMKWGIRRYQNKDGTLTPEGKRQYKYYNDIESKRKKFKNNLDKEGNALIKKSKKLSYDFGGKHENVDDHEYFRDIAKSYKLNTKKYEKSLNEYINNRKINIQNKKKINKAKKIVDKINKNNKKIQLKKERLNKALDYQWEERGHANNLSNIEYNAYKKVDSKFKNRSGSNPEYVKALTKELNKQADSLGISPSGNKRIIYNEKDVKYGLEEYGNLDRAYNIKETKTKRN